MEAHGDHHVGSAVREVAEATVVLLALAVLVTGTHEDTQALTCGTHSEK